MNCTPAETIYTGKHQARIMGSHFYHDPVANYYKAWIDLEVNDGKRCQGRSYRKWFNLNSDPAWKQFFNELLNIGYLAKDKKGVNFAINQMLGTDVIIQAKKVQGKTRVYILRKS